MDSAKSGPSTTATLFSILASAVTVIAYILSGGDSLLETLGRFLQPLFGGFLPGIGQFFVGLAATVVQFAASWPLGPPACAFLLFLVVAIMRYVGEALSGRVSSQPTLAGILVQAFFFLPVALLWVWMFSGVVTGLGMLAFVAGYFASVATSALLAAQYGW